MANRIVGAISEIKYTKTGLIGLILLTVLVTIALIAPLLPIPDPHSTEFQPFLPPSKAHPMGTDNLGRDIFSRVLWGTRTSLAVGLVAAGLSAIIGVLVGGIAGYYGGTIDDVLSRITEIFLVIPGFFLALLVVSIFGSSLINIMVVLGLLTWPSNARLMRAQALSLKEREFIQALKVSGVSDLKIVLRHIIPNGIQPIIANTFLQMAGAIITEAGLSFIGLGDPNVVSWGKMIYEGQIYITSYWWVPIFPGIFLVLTVLALNLLGDGLLTLLNPKLRRAIGVS
ncbi:ABC transporter permease [Thermococcus sp. M39]|uniref:ABC transporter permease n=1 Tax=unclassified Thermococcus TaxID=2627626 RepID=UPI001438B6E4|nr:MULTISPECIES: ABC transporter permease [unclassified Thermococcus]NJE08132.1 ABC transporter permease [Thermococcus sp. M39]NJE11625.1 ABC transporter permease [Thermococcus sp. LS2]